MQLFIHTYIRGGPSSPGRSRRRRWRPRRARRLRTPRIGRGDDTAGNLHRAQISRFELFELILLLNLDRRFPVEQFEATVSQSTVLSPPLTSLGVIVQQSQSCTPCCRGRDSRTTGIPDSRTAGLPDYRTTGLPPDSRTRQPGVHKSAIENMRS